MKTLDWYIVKKFLVTFVFTLGLFSLIAIFIDITEKLDDFIKRKPSIWVVIFEYYIYFLPYFFGMFSPIFVFLSAMFFNSKLAQNSEIIAMLNIGINYRRFLKPYLVGAAILSLTFIFLNTYLIPICDKKRYEFEETWLRDKKTTQSTNLSYVIDKKNIIHLESFNYLDSTGTNFSIEHFEDNQIKQRVFAHRIRWNEDSKKWRLEFYQRRIFNGKTEIVEKGNAIDTVINIKPEEFILKTKFISSMTNSELNDYIRKETEKGSPGINKHYVELYKRIASPISFLILTLLAVSISSRKNRGGTGLHLGIGIFLTFTFLLTTQVFNTLGFTNVMPPAIAVWTPNVLFLLVTLFVVKTAPK